jgi:hypothetical protein
LRIRVFNGASAHRGFRAQICSAKWRRVATVRTSPCRFRVARNSSAVLGGFFNPSRWCLAAVVTGRSPGAPAASVGTTGVQRRWRRGHGGLRRGPRVRLRRPWAVLCNACGVENSVEPRWYWARSLRRSISSSKCARSGSFIIIKHMFIFTRRRRWPTPEREVERDGGDVLPGLRLVVTALFDRTGE